MNNDDALARRGYIDGARNTVLAFHTHLPEFSVEVFDVRFMHCGKPVLRDEFNNAKEPLPNIQRQSVEFALDPSIENFDTLTHILNIISKKRLCPIAPPIRGKKAQTVIKTQPGSGSNHPDFQGGTDVHFSAMTQRSECDTPYHR